MYHPRHRSSHPARASVELIALHNQERVAAKLAPLVANDKLVAAAQIHARDMADHDKMSHGGSDGSKFNERIKSARACWSASGWRRTSPRDRRRWQR